jgi:uncharacterized protein (TIGR02270 family)
MLERTVISRVVPRVIQQHAEEAAILRHIRSLLLRAPHVQLHRLRRLDDRIQAHLDGLAESGVAGTVALRAMMEAPTAGTVFALSVCALRLRDVDLLRQVMMLAPTLPHVERGLLSALGWISRDEVSGIVNALIASRDPRHRAWGLAACAMHRLDPGAPLIPATQDDNPILRARAWRVAGQRGRTDLADAARHEVLARPPVADDPAKVIESSATEPVVWSPMRSAAWALTLWCRGQDDRVRHVLLSVPEGNANPPQDAHRLALLTAPLDWGRNHVRALLAMADSRPTIKRRVVRLVGWLGDVQGVPWLIDLMGDDRWARLAGEMFSLITGCDLAVLQLDRPTPEGFEPPPTEDASDHDVGLEEDDSLPWPDQALVSAWWQSNATRFVAGQRYFGGAPASVPHAVQALRKAGQRQRLIAAEYCCLLEPGRDLFPVAAPAWRQARWLSVISA